MEPKQDTTRSQSANNAVIKGIIEYAMPDLQSPQLSDSDTMHELRNDFDL